MLLKKLGLPRRIPKDIDKEYLITLMKKDKKVINQHVRLVLCQGWGNCYLDAEVTDSVLLDTLLHAGEGEAI